jgi:hypothetical protein
VPLEELKRRCLPIECKCFRIIRLAVIHFFLGEM